MAAILDFVNFHRFKELEKNAIPFFLITTMFQMGINKKITFNKNFARKYIRAYNSRLSMVSLVIIVAPSSLRVNTNSLLECGQRIRYNTCTHIPE